MPRTPQEVPIKGHFFTFYDFLPEVDPEVTPVATYFDAHLSHWKWFVVQWERGKDGTLHGQGCGHTHEKVRQMTFFKNTMGMPKTHVMKAKGADWLALELGNHVGPEAVHYCTKPSGGWPVCVQAEDFGLPKCKCVELDAIVYPNPLVHGEPPESAKSARKNAAGLKAARLHAMAAGGMSAIDILREDPSQAGNVRNVQALVAFFKPPLALLTRRAYVIVIYSPLSTIGKTQFTRQILVPRDAMPDGKKTVLAVTQLHGGSKEKPESARIKFPYSTTDEVTHVILEEFRGQMIWSETLQWFDIDPFPAWCFTKTVDIRSTYIYITTNKHFKRWFSDTERGGEPLDALYNRIDQVYLHNPAPGAQRVPRAPRGQIQVYDWTHPYYQFKLDTEFELFIQ